MMVELHPDPNHPLNEAIKRLDELLMEVRGIVQEARAARVNIDEALRYLKLQDAERAARRAEHDLMTGGGH